MPKRFGSIDLLGGGADDRGEFHLPVELLGDRGIVHDRLSGPDDARWRFGEDDRLLGQFGRGVERSRAFRDMVEVVEADAEDVLARAGDRGEQLHVGERQGRPHRPAPLGSVEQ